MNRQELILAVMAAGDGAIHTPVQMQKLLFLIDEKIPHFVDGPHFAFKPFDYGPFDRVVFVELERLEEENLVEIDRSADNRWNTYRLTKKGEEAGRARLNELSPNISDYIKRLSNWVRSISFSQLVSAIYRKFPEMKAKSVFGKSR